MGIKGFNPFLKEKSPSSFINLPYRWFKGKRVAWDCDNIFRKLMARAHKNIVNKTDVCVDEPDREEIYQLWLKYCRDEIFMWLQFGITPLFIFDGAYIDEKSETQKKRRKEKEKRIREAEELKQKIIKVDELERTPTMLIELRKKMHHLGYINRDEKDILIGILEGCGLPVMIATEEGEKLCAMLCIEGKVDAVYSRDTDVVAMGCPLTIREDGGWAQNLETNKMEQIVKCTIFKPVLADLKLEYESFLDLCIMAGCDFNANIFRCGIKTAHKLLLKCITIENLPSKYDEKKGILNHIRCREIFALQISDDITQGDVILNVNKDLENCRDILSIYNAVDWLEALVKLYKYLPKPSNVFIMKRPSYQKSRLKLKILGREEDVEDNKIPKLSKASPRAKKNRSMTTLHMRRLQKLNNRNMVEAPIISMDTPKRIKLKIIIP